MKEDKGPLILLIAFVVLALLSGIMAYLDAKAIEPDPPAKSLDMTIGELKRSIQELESDAAKYRDQATAYRKSIAEQNAIYDFNAELAAAYTAEYNRRRSLIDVGEKFDRQALDLDSSITKLKQQTLTNINADVSEKRD